MKRSVVVSLVAMGAATLAACEDKTIESAVYTSVDECVAARAYSPEKCDADYKAAVASHEKTAPAYKSLEHCEEEFGEGKCAPATSHHASGGSVFLPFMMGYMMGGRSVGPDPASVSPQALYRQPGKSGFLNANGVEIAKSSGHVRFSSRSSAARPPAASTTTLSRGGFGARAVSVSA